MRVLGTDLGCSTWRSVRITTVTHHPNHLSISVNKNEPMRRVISSLRIWSRNTAYDVTLPMQLLEVLLRLIDRKKCRRLSISSPFRQFSD